MRMYAAISLSASGNLVAAVTGQPTRIHGLVLSFSGACTFTINNGSGGTALTGTIKAPDSWACVIPESDGGWMTTTAGVAPYLTLSTSVTVGGFMVYENS